MTNKQYEHLGRALVAEAQLEVARSALDDIAEDLAKHLGALGVGDAKGWVKERYGRQFAVFHNARDFMGAVRQIVSAMDKEETR